MVGDAGRGDDSADTARAIKGKLPSNLQGLFEVRYVGDTLDADATIRLLEAMKDIKNQPLPSDASIND